MMTSAAPFRLVRHGWILAAFALGFGCSGGSVEDTESGASAASGQTFGQTSPPTFMKGASADKKRVSKFNLASGGATVSKLTAYLGGGGASSGSQSVVGVVYDASGGGGAPGARRCTTKPLTIAAGRTASWTDLPMAGACTLSAAGSYYLGLHSGPAAGVAQFGTTSVTGALYVNDDTYADGPTPTFGTAATDNYLVSIYASYTVTDTQAPSTPTGVSATAGSSRVSLIWNASTDNVGVTSYGVWRRLDTATTWTGIATTAAPSYVDTAVTNGTTYDYAVRAVDAAGNQSVMSNTVTATPVATTSGAPDLSAKRVKFSDDFESGNFNKWDGVLIDSGGAFTASTSIVKSGNYSALMSTVASTTRDELASWSTGDGHPGAAYGDELYYQWDTYLPSGGQWGGPNGNSGSSMTQFHPNESCYGGGIDVSYGGDTSTVLQWLGRTALFSEPHFILILRGGNLTSTGGGCMMQYQRAWDLGAVAFNQWTRLTLHIKWHGDPSVGFVEAWTNSAHSVPFTHHATSIFTGNDGLPAQNWLRLGYYGDPTTNGNRQAFDNVLVTYP